MSIRVTNVSVSISVNIASMKNDNGQATKLHLLCPQLSIRSCTSSWKVRLEDELGRISNYLWLLGVWQRWCATKRYSIQTPNFRITITLRNWKRSWAPRRYSCLYFVIVSISEWKYLWYPFPEKVVYKCLWLAQDRILFRDWTLGMEIHAKPLLCAYGRFSYVTLSVRPSHYRSLFLLLYHVQNIIQQLTPPKRVEGPRSSLLSAVLICRE